MLDQRPLPDARGITVLGVGLGIYAVVALVVSVLEG